MPISGRANRPRDRRQLPSKDPTQMLESQGRIPAAFPVFSRRTALTLGLAAGTGATLGRPMSAANAAVMAESLETTHGPEIPLTIIGNEPSIVLRRYRNVFSSVPDAAATFFRTDGGVLKIAGGCTGLADQLQILDAATGKREKSLVPFPGKGGGVGNAAYEAATGALLAYGAENTVKRVSLSGAVSDAYPVAPQSTNASFAVATDSKGRIWNGNYPNGERLTIRPRHEGDKAHGTAWNCHAIRSRLGHRQRR